VKCDQALALLKGLVDHDDGLRYFGSTLNYAAYLAGATRRGWVDDAGDPTQAGCDEYVRLGLYDLPDTGRYYLWDWSAIPDPTT
jgi:hypothetical protein